ncbi:MAG: hypothetical protein ACHQAQ_03360 [Hyphomicrobiales bacterium]
MKIVDPATVGVVTDDHPTGALGMRHLSQGRAGTPDNFMMVLAENLGHFQMVQHRHNFDQFRFCIRGDMNMGPHRTLREGHLGYFPEGASYGPQDDPAGPLALVVQFGGASGYGYMNMEQYRAGRAALNKSGRFEGPVYIRELGDGRVKKTFSINAIWEAALGEKLLLPAPRYDEPIFMNPRAYRSVPVKGHAGVARKLLGLFSERETMAEMWSLRPGAKYAFAARSAIRLLFVLEGGGKAGPAPLGQHFAIHLDPSEMIEIAAESEMTLLSFTLPLITDEEWTMPQEGAVEPIPNESVAEAA